MNTKAERETMILANYALVRAIAGRMVRRFPSSVDLNELVNIGVIGLIDAVDRFDSSRGVPFKAFAEIRIRGSIVDALRSDDHVPRSVRRKFHRIEEARTRLRRVLGVEPNRDQMATELELAPAEYDDLCGDAEIRRLISLDTPVDDDGGNTIGEQISGTGVSIERLFMEVEQVEEVKEAVERLPAKENTVVTLYYYRGWQLKEIGRLLGVTESRVCQLRGQAVGRLQTWLKRGESVAFPQSIAVGDSD